MRWKTVCARDLKALGVEETWQELCWQRAEWEEKIRPTGGVTVKEKARYRRAAEKRAEQRGRVEHQQQRRHAASSACQPTRNNGSSSAVEKSAFAQAKRMWKGG